MKKYLYHIKVYYISFCLLPFLYCNTRASRFASAYFKLYTTFLVLRWKPKYGQQKDPSIRGWLKNDKRIKSVSEIIIWLLLQSFTCPFLVFTSGSQCRKPVWLLTRRPDQQKQQDHNHNGFTRDDAQSTVDTRHLASRGKGGEVLIEEMEGWSPPILSPLIVLKGQLSYFFELFLRRISKQGHIVRLTMFLDF